MPFAAVIAALSALAAAAPAAIIPREPPHVVFKVSNFDARCDVHGSQCEYSFNLASAGLVGPGPSCDSKPDKPFDGTLPEVSGAGCFLTPGLVWHVEKHRDGSLELKADIDVLNIHGSHIISWFELRPDEDHGGRGQHYIGDKTFDLLG